MKIMETEDRSKQNLMITKYYITKFVVSSKKICRGKSIHLYAYIGKNRIKIDEQHI